jgi:uncharacterized protein YodC (DUF2158 family)
MEDLEVGDVVVLASGGPAMTVADVLPWGEVFCLWFTEDRKCTGEVFNRCLLRHLNEALEDTPTAPFYAPTPTELAAPRTADGTPPLGYEAFDGDTPTVQRSPLHDPKVVIDESPPPERRRSER